MSGTIPGRLRFMSAHAVQKTYSVVKCLHTRRLPSFDPHTRDFFFQIADIRRI
jgi:hypothetical protein